MAIDRSDAALLEAARQGEREAIDALVDRYQARVYRFGMKMCRDPEDAKDVLQETLLAMTRTVKTFRGAASVSTWLYGIARSYCIKKRRKSKFAPVETSLEGDARQARQVVDPERGPEEQTNALEVRAALERGIAALEPMYREVLLLRDVEGLTAPEVAEALEISVAAVKSRLHRARLAVREEVAPLLGFHPAPSETCPDVVQLFSRYLEGEISADRCERMQQHLAGCGACHDACESLKRTLAMCQQTPVARVPGYVSASVREAIRDFLRDG